ncbi:MAG: hypothetical protein Q7U72_05145 [Brevundimonas sp.]|uniref:hypothetical protein n=1 Tax=Brevundimonas sp. TaxID=1871086 RepID=UPI00271AF8E4|nr:hypothetical protein [Brevundimonas sp.]MDO9076821.1 hypothetical protein [Brevundimonas sp.]MDZ4059740.1 hypothetical protein [Brevundimonas sp.]
MRRSPILKTALLAAASLVLSAGGASAQTAGAPAGEGRGLRYLSWPGRSEAAPAAPAAAPVAAAGRRDLRRPNTVIPHGGFASAPPAPARPGLTPAPGARRTLTPANAWMQPVAPPPEPVMVPPAAAPVAPRPAPAPPPAPQPRATPDYLPDPGGRQAVPAGIIYAPAPAQPAPAESGPFDPMAPRRDAPIFRMQQEAPAAAPAAAPPVIQPVAASPAATPQPRRVAEVSNSGERPPVQGGRYYSVHRQNGRQPDALEMPAPNYVDALVVTMPETIASQDLAAPEQGPTLIRDAQGRVRPAPAASDGDHQ